MYAIANFYTLEDLLGENFTDPCEVAETPSQAIFAGGAVRFLKKESPISVQVELPVGTTQLATESWSEYNIFVIPPVNGGSCIHIRVCR